MMTLHHRLKERLLIVCRKLAADGPVQEALDYKEGIKKLYKMKNKMPESFATGCEMSRWTMTLMQYASTLLQLHFAGCVYLN